MTTEKLDIMETIKEGVRYGLRNFLPLLVMVILYALTFWIPYLNVGTTIGLYKAVIAVGRGGENSCRQQQKHDGAAEHAQRGTDGSSHRDHLISPWTGTFPSDYTTEAAVRPKSRTERFSPTQEAPFVL